MILGLDLGTVRLGVALADDAMPLRILAADTWSVDEHDLAPIADRVRAEVDDLAGPDGIPAAIVVEFGALYIPKGASQAAARQIAANHATMSRMLLLIWQACPGPVYRVTTIARRSWSSRVLPKHPGGITTAEGNDALARHMDPDGAWWTLTDQHRRDAAGAIAGVLLGAPARAARPTVPGAKRNRKRQPYVPRQPSPKALARLAEDARLDALLEEGQAAIAARLPLPGSRMLEAPPERERVAGRAYRFGPK